MYLNLSLFSNNTTSFSAMKQLLILLMAVIIPSFAWSKTGDATPVKALAERILGSEAKHFEFKLTTDKGIEKYSIESVDNQIVVEGNSISALCSGLNYYLKNYACTSVSWYLNEPVYIPSSWPAVDKKITIESRIAERFFLNYCTFGYTLPYWNQQQWERLIDWMALNGVNMALAITGQEAVWYNVWRNLGMTDNEIRSYFTGPSQLPWHRMCNVDAWQGPLPVEWLENQKDLQKFIVSRERELGMKTVLPAFGGHIPARLKELHPEIQTHDVGSWGGYEAPYTCTFLYPSDPMYTKIQKAYLEEQTRLYGTDHLYGVDCFNEVDPPSFDHKSLRDMGKKVYESLAAVDPKATWIQMAWLFYYRSNLWTNPCIKAYLSGVPKGKMQFLDYYCDFTELWPTTESFFGHDFIWCFLGNFGGNTYLSGDHKTVKNRLNNTLANAGKSVKGIGSTLEAFDVNPYLYEMVFDHAWNQPLDEAGRITSLARRRSGSSPEAREAWQILADSIYVECINGNRGTLNCSRPTLKEFANWKVTPTYVYQNSTLTEAWRLMLEADGEGRDTYNYDIVNIGRQALGNLFMDIRDGFTKAYEARDVDAMRVEGAKMKELINDISTLLACHESFSLRSWIADSRNNISTEPALQDYFESNARTIITIWGTEQLTDYANRALAELNDQYYGERWRRFIDAVIASVVAGTEWNQDAFDKSIREFELAWIDPKQQVINYLPAGDAKSTAKALYSKWFGK